MFNLLAKNINKIIRIIFPFIFLAIGLMIPTPETLSYKGHVMLAILAFAAPLFIMQPVPLGIAGLLILIMPVILGVSRPVEIFNSFGNPAVFFLIGAFIIAASIEKTGIHKRIALWFLKISSFNPRIVILATMITGMCLSLIMPEHGVIVLIVPVFMYILVGMRLTPKKSNFAKAMMIGSSYGCTIGSLATPLGGARNPLTIGFLSYHKIEIGFTDWFIIAFPLVILSLIAVWLTLIFFFPPEVKHLKRVITIIKREVQQLPKISATSIRIMIVMGLCVLMWIFLPMFTPLNISIIAIIGAILLFFVGRMRWEDIETHIPWGIILLYGGVISMGINLAESGAAQWLANLILSITHDNILAVIIIIVLFTKLLTEFMSNTAAVSILLPIAYGISQTTALSPQLACMLVGLSGGLAFMFLVSTPGNLISFSTGYFSQWDLFKAGIYANLVTFFIIIVITLTYWKWIGLW